MASDTSTPAEPFLEPHQVIVRPLVTEKGTHRSTRYNAYAFEVNRLIIRTIYLVVLGALLAYAGTYERRLREKLAALGDSPPLATSEADEAVGALLGHAARVLGAPRAALVWDEEEEPWSNLAMWSDDALEWQRAPPGAFEPLAPEGVADRAFLLPAPVVPGGGFRVVTREGDPDPKRTQARIVERSEIGQLLIGPRHERERRPVVRLRRADPVEADRSAHNHVAAAGTERIPHEAASLNPPRVLEARAELLREDSRDSILEALSLLVRVGQTGRIGADAELTAPLGERG